MAWNFADTVWSTQNPVLADAFNDIAADFKTWGGNVDAAGYSLTNCGSVTVTGGSSALRFNNRSGTAGQDWGWYATGGEARLFDYANTANRIVVLQNGSVGIAAATPPALLSVRDLGSAGNAPNAAFFGMSADGSGVIIARSTANPYELWLGVNQASGYAEIQAAQGGSGFKNLILNRQGGNIGIGTASFPASLAGGVAIANGTAPSANPSGGGVLFVESGALKYRGSSGTVTTLGAA